MVIQGPSGPETVIRCASTVPINVRINQIEAWLVEPNKSLQYNLINPVLHFKLQDKILYTFDPNVLAKAVNTISISQRYARFYFHIGGLMPMDCRK